MKLVNKARDAHKIMVGSLKPGDVFKQAKDGDPYIVIGPHALDARSVQAFNIALNKSQLFAHSVGCIPLNAEVVILGERAVPSVPEATTDDSASGIARITGWTCEYGFDQLVRIYMQAFDRPKLEAQTVVQQISIAPIDIKLSRLVDVFGASFKLPNTIVHTIIAE